jgi:TrmH family RNA methyltransferase
MMKYNIYSENDTFQIIQSIKNNRTKRRQLKEAFIEGTKIIKQAQKANCTFTRFIIQKDVMLSDWAKGILAEHPDVPVYILSKELFSTISDRNDVPELMATVKIHFSTIADLQANKEKHRVIVVIDRPSDAGNLGSIVRSCNAFGVDAICITGHGVDIWEGKTIRASMGACFFTPIFYTASNKELTDYINSENQTGDLKVVGTDSNGDIVANAEYLSGSVMIIIGNEAKGISVELRQLCDNVVRIPIQGEVNSLNVACAASIIIYEATKRTS